MDEHRWTMPARSLADRKVEWKADRTGLWMDGELIGFPEASREILRLAEHVGELERRTVTLADVREAVNASCTCGGAEPGACCPACEVWHRLRGARLHCSDGERHVPREDGLTWRCQRCDTLLAPQHHAGGEG